MSLQHAIKTNSVHEPVHIKQRPTSFQCCRSDQMLQVNLINLRRFIRKRSLAVQCEVCHRPEETEKATYQAPVIGRLRSAGNRCLFRPAHLFPHLRQGHYYLVSSKGVSPQWSLFWDILLIPPSPHHEGSEKPSVVPLFDTFLPHSTTVFPIYFFSKTLRVALGRYKLTKRKTTNLHLSCMKSFYFKQIDVTPRSQRSDLTMYSCIYNMQYIV